MVSDLMTPPVVIGPVPSNQPARAYPVNGSSFIHPGIGYNLQIASTQEDPRTARNCRSRTLAGLDSTTRCLVSVCSFAASTSINLYRFLKAPLQSRLGIDLAASLVYSSIPGM